VKDGESWKSLAQVVNWDPWRLIRYNYPTLPPEIDKAALEVNWYLQEYVHCTKVTHDGRNYVFSTTEPRGIVYLPPQTKIRLSVPMRVQEQNPICWVACAAMIASYKGRWSVGIGNFTGGFDPSNSSIPNPAKSQTDYYRLLSSFGFVTENPFPISSPDASYIEDLLRKHGPWMLYHFASDLLPGNFGPNQTHAVVVTGIDRSTNQVWYNNPWGKVDEVATVDKILLAMEHSSSSGMRPVAYMP
jgi:hypothetical protein